MFLCGAGKPKVLKSLAGKTAQAFFADCMAGHGGNLPPFAISRSGASAKRRGALVLSHFKAMATAGERELLMGDAWR